MKLYVALEGYDFLRDRIITEVNISYLLHFVVTYIVVVKKIMKLDHKDEKVWKIDIGTIGLIIFCFVTIMTITAVTNMEYKLYMDELIELFITQFLFIATCEELVYRVSISRLLSHQNLGEKKKILISALAFVMVHYLALGINIFTMNFVDIFKMLLIPSLFGVLFAIIFEKKHRAVPLIVLHGSYNIITMISFGIVKNIVCVAAVVFIISAVIIIKEKEKKHVKESDNNVIAYSVSNSKC